MHAIHSLLSDVGMETGASVLVAAK